MTTCVSLPANSSAQPGAVTGAAIVWTVVAAAARATCPVETECAEMLDPAASEDVSFNFGVGGSMSSFDTGNAPSVSLPRKAIDGVDAADAAEGASGSTRPTPLCGTGCGRAPAAPTTA